MRATLIGGLLTAGLLMGCGGVEGSEAGAQEPLPVTAQEAAGLFCSATYTYVWYSDATYTTPVGREVCRCGFKIFRTGDVTPYVSMTQWKPCGIEN